MKAKFNALLSSVVMLLTIVPEAEARDYFVDPTYGAAQSDGSSSSPWRSLDAVLDREVLEPGDTVYLRSGDYGRLWINGRQNKGPITISSDHGHVSRFVSIRISSSTNWHLRGLSVSPSFALTQGSGSMIKLDSNVADITIENCILMSVPDISLWTASDWNTKALNGIDARGTRVTLRNNRIKNANHGLVVRATHSIVENNVVENFSGDGMRGLGDYTTFRSNIVKNCYGVNDNHDDGFQSWSIGKYGRPGTGEVVGLVLSGNTIINYEDPHQPFRCTLQGIGLFDGTYVDSVIENNVVITDHWHGITVMGARNVRIINNTVIDPNDVKPGPPWITITAHKDGTPPVNSFIINNLATSFNRIGISKRQFPTSSVGVIEHHNMVVTDPDIFFQDAEHFDLRLGSHSPAIDAGASEFAPILDIQGNRRPVGHGVDLGAYERQ